MALNLNINFAPGMDPGVSAIVALTHWGKY